jgi:hypothetical protein
LLKVNPLPQRIQVGIFLNMLDRALLLEIAGCLGLPEEHWRPTWLLRFYRNTKR